MHATMGILCVRSFVYIHSYAEISIPCAHWSGIEAAAVSRFDWKELCSKWAHPSADPCVDKGMVRRRRGWGGRWGETVVWCRGQNRGRTAQRSLTVKCDGCGISTPCNSCPVLSFESLNSDCSMSRSSEDWPEDNGPWHLGKRHF